MKVSCILPTRGRREMARQAFDCFMAQTYTDKELIIVDDGDDPSFHGMDWDGVDIVSHVVVSPRLSIPEKRQRCCELATGDVIAHFDSDDWSDPGRLHIQMEVMQQSGKQVVGFHTMLFYDVVDKKAFKYQGWSAMALGTSLLYQRDFWKRHGWEKTKSGLASDNEFVRHAEKAGELHSVDGGAWMVARAHPDNSGHKRMYLEPFKPVPLEELPTGFPR